MSISTEPTSRTARTEAELQAMARDHLWMHFSRQSVMTEGPGVPIIVKGEGHRIWDSAGKEYIDGLAGLFVVNAGHGRRRLAEAGARQAEQLAFFPIWSYAHPAAIELADRIADLAPGDLNHVFFSTGGGEAVETAFKLAKHYWKLAGQPTKHKVISRYIAYHGTPQGALAITGLPGMKSMFEPVMPGGFRVPEHELLPRGRDGLRRRHARGVRRLGGRPHRGDDQLRGTRHRGRRLPRAGAELGRLLPATPRLLPARARDLRQVRRAARLGRGHLRVRAPRPLLRRRRLRLPARHDHVREGGHERLLAARRHDRERPRLRAVRPRSRSRSRTATRSAATRSRPRSRSRTSTSSRRRACSRTCARTRPCSARPSRS